MSDEDREGPSDKDLETPSGEVPQSQSPEPAYPSLELTKLSESEHGGVWPDE
jgi:hypothetical protein